jgi:hypothetical protein
MMIQMFRIEDGKDITDDEFINIVEPHRKLMDDYIENFIAPNIVAYYIYSGYTNSAIWEGSFRTTANDCLDLLNYTITDYKKLLEMTDSYMQLMYHFKIVATDPVLKIKEV